MKITIYTVLSFITLIQLIAIKYTSSFTSAVVTEISGTVYIDDIFGDNNYPTTSGIGSTVLPDGTNQQLYAYAVHDIDNIIVAKSIVASNGTYVLAGSMIDNIEYDVVISTIDRPIGEIEPFERALTGYIFSAERDDDGSIYNPGDGNVDISSGSNASISNIDFWMAPQNYLVSGAIFEDDTDDNTVNGIGIGQPEGQTLYVYLVNDATDVVFYKSTVNINGVFSISGGASGSYDVIVTTQNLNIGDSEPAQPYLLPSIWTYVGDLREDGTHDPLPEGSTDLGNLTANVSNINFGIRNGLTLSGQVFADSDRANNGADGIGIGAPAGQQLYIYLVDNDEPSPLVLHAATVNADGTYIISGIASGNYYVHLTTEIVLVGSEISDPPEVLLPEGWIITVEDEQGTINGDGIVDGRIETNSLVFNNTSNLNYSVTPVNYISGTVTLDTDFISDSIGDVPPQDSYLVYLLDMAGNNVLESVNNYPIYDMTGTDGSYFLNDIPAGDYEIHIFDNVGYETIADTDNTNDGVNDADLNSSTSDKVIPVSIIADENDTGNDFIIKKQNGICLDWGDQGLTDDISFPNNSTFMTGGIDVTMSWNVVDTNGSLSPATGEIDFVQFEDGRQGGHSDFIGLSMNNTENNQADYVEVVFTFNGTFTNLEFDVLDVDMDSENPPGFVDAVEILYNGSNNIYGTSFYTLSTINTDEFVGGGITGFKGQLFETNPYETSSNIAVDFGNTPITDVTIRYYTGPDAWANPGSQFIGISDLCWENDYDISGKVFMDEDGLNDGQVDGIGIGAPNGEQIYAYLIEDNSNIIIAVDSVASDGTFSFLNQLTGVGYDVEISTELLLIGDSEPSPHTYPTNWTIIGEYDPENGTTDDTPGGNIDLNPLIADVDSVFFGLLPPANCNAKAPTLSKN